MDDLYRYLDLRTSQQRRYETNNAGSLRPIAGDFWHEMFSPVCVVLEADGNRVLICQKTKPAGNDRYEFDLAHTTELTLQQFRELLTYSSMRDKFHCDCMPGRGLPTVEAWLAQGDAARAGREG